MATQVIAYPSNAPRVETGPVQFGDDWPGLFIRGDNCFALQMDIQAIRACISRVSASLADADRQELEFLSSRLGGLVDIINGEVIIKPKK